VIRTVCEGRSSIEQSNSKHLEVHQVGAYVVSIAKNVDDLRRIDPTVFKVSDTIDQLFRKHYATGFGFIICSFDPSQGVKGHPIGYVHDLLPDGSLFVPCRHEHGHGEQATETFSHEIYSLNTQGAEAGVTRTELGYSGPDTTKQAYKAVPIIVPAFVAKPPKEAPKSGGGIITTDVKCGGCTFFGGISGFCSKCWNQLSEEDKVKHTAEQKIQQPLREKAAWDKARQEEAHRVSTPHSEAEALQSGILTPHVPEIKCLRQRLIQGKYKNEDLVFVQA